MDIPPPNLPQKIRVTSPAFVEGGMIPTLFTCKGAGTSPAFTWSGVPSDAVALAVVVSDPDAPRGTFLHWLVTELPVGDGAFAEGAAPDDAVEWPSSTTEPGWCPPCPPSGTHRYYFAVHALDAPVTGDTSQQVIDRINAHTIAWGSVMGRVQAR